MSKVVHIAGKGIGWKLAPKEGEVWGVNDLVLYRNVTRVFHIHSNLDMTNPYIEKIVKRVNELKVPFMAARKVPQIPTSVAYPLGKIRKRFGADYFTNSVDYMIAYALYVGMKEINFYGINMEVGSEYIWQKPGIEFWIGYAKGLGVKVNFFGNHCLLLLTRSGKLYGYWTKQTSARLLIKELEQLSRDKKLQEYDLSLYYTYVRQHNRDEYQKMRRSKT